MTDKEWDKFLKWLYKAHSITRDWIPDKESIKLWEEYKCRHYLSAHSKKPAISSVMARSVKCTI